MNIDIIRNQIEKNLNKKVKIYIYALRNKSYIYNGIINGIYPNLFTVLINGETKSFSYADIATKEIVLEYQ